MYLSPRFNNHQIFKSSLPISDYLPLAFNKTSWLLAALCVVGSWELEKEGEKMKRKYWRQEWILQVICTLLEVN